MKNFKILMLSAFVAFAFTSCIDDDNDALTGGATTGGLVNVNNALLSYVVGSGSTYTAAGSVYQGSIQTTSVDIYKSFTDNVSGVVSNEILLTSVPISNTTIGESVSFSLSFTYEDLIAGLTLSGSPLPADDSQLNIGDFWSLRYVGNTSAGDANSNASTTKVAVGTRYAGVYTTVESQYWNSGSFLGNWNGGDRIIESVDATIYRHSGHAYWDAEGYFFTVDSGTNYITVLPEDLEGNAAVINTSPIMTCEGAGGYSFEMIPCNATTSKATPDDVNGEDQLEFTVGYFRGIGATREFYSKIIKQVD